MIFEELKLQTASLEELKIFYAEILELDMSDSSAEHFTVRIGWTSLTFVRAIGGSPFYHYAVNIPENLMPEAKAWLQRRVVLNTVDGEDEVFFTSWNAHSVYFEDPAGNIIEFIARHNLSNAANGPFTSDMLECVSEIGIVRDQVIPFVRELNAKDLPNWKEDSEGLTPVGDEQGLFIVVRDQRPWFFSKQLASPYPVAVKVRGMDWMEL